MASSTPRGLTPGAGLDTQTVLYLLNPEYNGGHANALEEAAFLFGGAHDALCGLITMLQGARGRGHERVMLSAAEVLALLSPLEMNVSAGMDEIEAMLVDRTDQYAAALARLDQVEPDQAELDLTDALAAGPLEADGEGVPS